jgi:ABC-2 type transport system ATP-binding protein
LAFRLDALAASERLARAPARPAVGVTAQWDLANPNGRYFPPEAIWQESWSVGVAASWTLFDGGRARFEAAVAAASLRALAAERAELERGILLEVSTARTALESALAAAAAADAAHAAALAREQATRERHEAGLVSIVDVLDADAGLADTEVGRYTRGRCRRGATRAGGRLVSAAPVVEVRELTRTFGDFVAVDRVSFAVQPGEVFGFLGSNGAGKTTTIRMLCGLLAPSGGSAAVLGLDIARDAHALKRRIGYMSQRFSLYTDLTVDENLRFWGGAQGLGGSRLAERADWAVAMAGLEQRRGALVRELPVGFRQRLALGAALLHFPALVFLDEPTGGVDPEARRRFWDLIDGLSDAGTTIFVTTHYMDEAERCHRVALMHAGRLLALDTVPGLKAPGRRGSPPRRSRTSSWRSPGAVPRERGRPSADPDPGPLLRYARPRPPARSGCTSAATR